jgi:hypothetical protein
MTRFSVILIVLLLISLPLKLSYFKAGNTADEEVQSRQTLVNDIAAHLAPLGFNVIPTLEDPFLPSGLLYKGDCTLIVTPLPVTRDLDNSFVFENADFDGSLIYYYDGKFFTDAPVNAPKFWENAARALPKIGITIRERIRLGIAYSDACDLEGLQLDLL